MSFQGSTQHPIHGEVATEHLERSLFHVVGGDPDFQKQKIDFFGGKKNKIITKKRKYLGKKGVFGKKNLPAFLPKSCLFS